MVLGKTKVMSYEDLEEACAKCSADVKATARKDKGNIARKGKNPPLRAEAKASLLEGEAGSSLLNAKVARIRGVEPTEAFGWLRGLQRQRCIRIIKRLKIGME